MPRKKKSRQHTLSETLRKKESFLLNEFRMEWDTMQKRYRKEEFIRRAKEAGYTIEKIILALILLGGVLTIAAIAPNIFVAFGRMTRRRNYFDRRQLSDAMRYLQKNKFVAVKKDGMHRQVELTDKGHERILTTSYENLRIQRIDKWDGMWRIVVFDIPNRHKWGRECFRDKLKEMGFYPMQESIFVTPFPCEREVDFVTSLFFLEKYIRYIESSFIRNDRDVRAFFKIEKEKE